MVASVRTGLALPKREVFMVQKDVLVILDGANVKKRSGLCIEDPFEERRFLGTSCEGQRLMFAELQRAAAILRSVTEQQERFDEPGFISGWLQNGLLAKRDSKSLASDDKTGAEALKKEGNRVWDFLTRPIPRGSSGTRHERNSSSKKLWTRHS